MVVFGLAKNFTKEYKYTLGESIKKESIEAATNIYRANVKKDKTEYLEKTRENIEVLRLYIRLAKDLKLIQILQLPQILLHIRKQLSKFA